MKRKPTTKRQFQEFKKEFIRMQHKLGMTEWRVCFYHDKTDRAIATITLNHDGLRADIVFSDTLPEEDYNGLDPKEHARHEALHLLTSPLFYVGECRFVRPDDLHEQWEKLVRRLEKVVK